MRHHVRGKKLDRNTGTRKALRVVLMKSLIQYERIKTTRAKAQYIEAHVEHLITIAKRALKDRENDTPELKAARKMHASRVIASRLNNDRQTAFKVVNTLAPRYSERPGGYTRMIRLGARVGDSADMVFIEFVDRDESAAAPRKKKTDGQQQS